ncbi:MAG TPA: DUF354 domain-containing protein [Desulfobacterales bacterium]|nr:DUF354 domain-containing protein [Desulfobacterales bacterium]
MFKNLILAGQKKGWEFMILVSEKDILKDLLKSAGFEFHIIGKNRPTILRKCLEFFRYFYNTYRYSKKFKPDVYIAQALPHFGFVSFLRGADYYIFEDTEKVSILHGITIPCCTNVFTPDCFEKELGKKQIKINTYFELLYLHPIYFTPEPSILEILGISKDEKYVILRFVSWTAHHDVGHLGLNLDMKRKAVREFSKYARVFISSEKELPEDLEKYRIKISPQKMHDALYYATLLYGESATMATECAVLGTPAIFLDNDGRSTTDEEEKNYSLVFNYSESLVDQELSIQKGIELLKQVNLKQEWVTRRQKMLSEKIDVTAFLVWLIENYPESTRMMNEKPNYQQRFK